MVDKLGLLRETSSAVKARKWFFARVDPLMRVKAGFLSERFPARGTRKRLHSGVGPQVRNKIRLVPESL